MTSRISHTTFDAINAYAQSLFWSQVLDFVEDSDDPNLPEHEECLITSRDGSQLLLFVTVPDAKQPVKNRVHLDLRPADRSREVIRHSPCPGRFGSAGSSMKSRTCDQKSDCV
jgi:hypothetical protein